MIELLGKNKGGRVKKKTTKTKVYSGQQRRNSGRSGIDRGGYSPISQGRQRGTLSNDGNMYRPQSPKLNPYREVNVPTQDILQLSPGRNLDVQPIRNMAKKILQAHNEGSVPITDGQVYEKVDLIANYYTDDFLAINAMELLRYMTDVLKSNTNEYISYGQNQQQQTYQENPTFMEDPNMQSYEDY